MRKFHTILTVLVIAILIMSCGSSKKSTGSERRFDEQAHRGGRGLMPENTIAAMKDAIDYGCTLELDLQMSKDKKIVVSHDPFLNNLFVLTPEGDSMTKKDSRSRLLYNMDYDSIAKYDVGSKFYPLFPEQKKIKAIKPLLATLIDSAEAYAAIKNHVNHYNIEIKSNPEKDGKTYPSVAEFVDSALSIVISKGIAPRTMMQSFDVRALRLIHDQYPQVKTSFLVEASNKNTVRGYLDELGFIPAVFSPHYSLVTPELVKAFHQSGVLVIPWTINTAEEIQKIKDMGVDGVITDYPNLFAEVHE